MADPTVADPNGQGGSAGTGEGGRRPWIRVVTVVGAVLALVVLVLTRLGGDPSTSDATRPDVAGAPPTSGTGERIVPALPDPPSALTDSGGIRFTDVTDAAGLAGPQSDRPLVSAGGMTSGAAVGDVDADGWDDIFVPRVGLPDALYRNNGNGTFTDVAASAGVSGRDPSQGSTTAAFADVEGDGDLDLVVAGAGSQGLALYINDGTSHFRDEAGDRGLSLPVSAEGPLGAQIHGLTFGDVDHDGSPDLLVAQWDTALFNKARDTTPPTDATPSSGSADVAGGGACSLRSQTRSDAPRAPGSTPNLSRLLLNDGSGRFRDATAAYGLRLDLSLMFTPQLVDIDGDGWEDLVFTGDACTSRVYRNVVGQRFEDLTERSGAGTDENGMGSVVRDIDGDGHPDWFVTSIAYPTADGTCPARARLTGCSGNRLYLGRGDGTFEDATDRYGLRNGWWGWGAAIEDFGNDGRLAVVMTNGYVEDSAPGGDRPEDPNTVYFSRFRDDPLRFWLPGGSPSGGAPMQDAAALVGMSDNGVGHALVPFDADRDGRLDVLVANTGTGLRLFRNESPPERGWVTVRLRDPGRTGDGSGARVEVRTGTATVVGWITTSGSYESQKPAEFHVGLGDRHDPVSVAIWWPGGSGPQVVDDVAVDRVVTIDRQ